MNSSNKRVIGAGLLGGVLVFVYGLAVWMICPIYKTFFPLIPQYGRVQALLAQLPLKESVMYRIAEWNSPGLKGMVQIASKTCHSPYSFLAGLFLNIGVSLLMIRFYVHHLQTKGSGMTHLIRFYLFVGLITHGLWHGVQVIWMNGDPVLHGILIVDGLVGFLIMGWVAGWILRPAKK